MNKFLNKVDSLAIKARPWIPFTTLNSVWRMMGKDTKTVLDIGCGKGEPMKFINRQKLFYTVGVDVFKPYLQDDKKAGTHNEYVQCNVQRLPFKEKSFDTVICMEVLEHFEKEEGEKLLQIMEEHARKEVILSTPIGKYNQKAYDGNASQEHRYTWKPSQLKDKGYEVKVLGLRNMGGDDGIIARLPNIIKPFGILLWVLAGPLVYFLPNWAGEVVCRKRLAPRSLVENNGVNENMSCEHSNLSVKQ